MVWPTFEVGSHFGAESHKHARKTFEISIAISEAVMRCCCDIALLEFVGRTALATDTSLTEWAIGTFAAGASNRRIWTGMLHLSHYSSDSS